MHHILERENSRFTGEMAEKESDGRDAAERPIVAKTAVDLQRLKLLKLMKNPVRQLIHLLPIRVPFVGGCVDHQTTHIHTTHCGIKLTMQKLTQCPN